jgi:hypothetical protein
MGEEDCQAPHNQCVTTTTTKQKQKQSQHTHTTTQHRSATTEPHLLSVGGQECNNEPHWPPHNNTHTTRGDRSATTNHTYLPTTPTHHTNTQQHNVGVQQPNHTYSAWGGESATMNHTGLPTTTHTQPGETGVQQRTTPVSPLHQHTTPTHKTTQQPTNTDQGFDSNKETPCIYVATNFVHINLNFNKFKV